MSGPPAPVSRPRRSRDDLLDGLVELFLAEGFAHFGVGDLAARMRCSRTTLYDVAQSKDQLVLAVVRRYFRRAATRIESRVAGAPDPALALAAYLTGVAAELAPAGAAFRADLAASAGPREVYRDNTARAARRVQELVTAGVEAGAMRPVNARFVGAAVAEVMSGIQQGVMLARSGLDDAAAYEALADLVAHALARPHVPR